MPSHQLAATGGEDSISNTVALCPNCHRKMHVLNQTADREKLIRRTADRVTNDGEF